MNAAAPKEMNPNRFTVNERVRYENHVTGQQIGLHEVIGLDGEFVLTASFLSRGKTFEFHRDGRATWSSNLSICHEGRPNPHAERSRSSTASTTSN